MVLYDWVLGDYDYNSDNNDAITIRMHEHEIFFFSKRGKLAQ